MQFFTWHFLLVELGHILQNVSGFVCFSFDEKPPHRFWDEPLDKIWVKQSDKIIFNQCDLIVGVLDG